MAERIKKEVITAVRMEKLMFDLLNEHARKYATGSNSETLRKILKAFFAPALYKKYGYELEKQRSGKVFSPGEFDNEVEQFLEFLREAKESAQESLSYIEDAIKDYEEIAEKNFKFDELWKIARQKRQK